MKRAFLMSLVLTVCVSLFSCASVMAEGLSDWKDTDSSPKEGEDGIKFTVTETGKLGYAVYNVPLDPKNITVDITPEYCENKTDNDAWVAVNFLGVPEIFNLSDQAKTPGFVTLYYNYNGTFRIQLDGYGKGVYEERNSWRLLEKGTPLKVGERNTIELKWNEKENIFNLFINGKQIDDQGQLAMAKPEIMFPENKAYVVVATYAGGGKPAEYTVHRINDTYFGTNPKKVETSTGAGDQADNGNTGTTDQNGASSENTSETAANDTTAETDTMAENKEDGTNTPIIITVVAAVLLLGAGGVLIAVKSKSKKA